MHPVLANYDDLRIVSRDLTERRGFTLTAIIHNEMHFLPKFLSHYRALGVERFIFVNDRSTDGSLAFLQAQDDVMVLESDRRYADMLAEEDQAALGLPHRRVELVLRALLIEKYASDVWSLHLDADEFLDLPDGVSVRDLAARLGADGARALWAVMLDMYPADLAGLDAMREDETIDLQRDWYFDGRRHLWVHHFGRPTRVYPGVRARLLDKFGLNRKSAGWAARLKLRVPSYNAIRKPVFLRWEAGQRFDSAHTVSLPMSPRYLLPLRHFKFSGAVYDRIIRAKITGKDTSGGREYQDLLTLLNAMSAGDPVFTTGKSVRYTGFADFQRTGNADGF